MNPTIEHNFKYHPPTVASGEAHARVRAAAKELAQIIDDLVPQNAGREKAIALTNVEQAMMWACGGIARHSANGSAEYGIKYESAGNPHAGMTMKSI